ncbi:DUF7312 domain-containing protein [Natranaeroarchaeum sulfidigenes]|uniref:DUF7312 domain-containing protein n=1 Tax=Natranaeroarchaeum sulfidigenes TaxID=2784880 RepID=A0A897MU48_9EURY|nr:hypothetical protein [Natranaeroarchaeum sulfidigenes]QSG03558.1 Uncharacterized protein AArcS_2362 [Natranaeroarchaeum sulfidigenes]
MTDGSGEPERRGESEQPPTGPPAGREDPSPDSANNVEIEADDEWRFGVDDVDENGIVNEDRRIDTSIEPETIAAENAVFVVLGVLIAVLILARTVTVFA